LRGFTSSAAQPTTDRDRTARGPESLARKRVGARKPSADHALRAGAHARTWSCAHGPRTRTLGAPHPWSPALLGPGSHGPARCAGRSDRRGLQAHPARSSAKRAWLAASGSAVRNHPHGKFCAVTARARLGGSGGGGTASKLFRDGAQRQSTRKECPMGRARCEGAEADHSKDEDCKAARCEEELEGAHDRFPGPNAAH